MGGIPERFFIHMRHVHLHLQGIDLLNQIDTCRCQSRPSVRATGKRTVNAAAEAVRNIPERTNAADPGGIKGLQVAALAIKTSGTLNMRHHRQYLILAAAFDIRRAQTQSQASSGVGDKLLQDGQLLPEDIDRIPSLAGVLRRHTGNIFLRWHE